MSLHISRFSRKFKANSMLLAFLDSIDLTSFNDFSEWFKTTSQGRHAEVAELFFVGSQIMLQCLKCSHDPFVVYRGSNGRWNIGKQFTKHCKECHEVHEASMSMDTSDDVTMTLDFMTLFMSS